MKNIGKYNGIPCYECTHGEYVDAYEKDMDNGKQIFIINGVMVRRNVIVGIYDGKHVKDQYDDKVYYRSYDKNDVMQFKASTANDSKDEAQESRVTETATAASYEELVMQDIDFSKYSTIVDEFFALLDVN